jgi:multiple sugar transport system ATP-binding protein
VLSSFSEAAILKRRKLNGEDKMAAVTISNVEKAYAEHKVLHGINIDIKDGEFVVLVGPSGCGKSTLLRMTAGLESISGGTISIGSRIVNNVPPKDRDIAMVFQSYALYPHKTVAENMVFALKLKKLPQAEIEARLKTAADILGLQPYLNRYPRQLSGGQRQRVAMGRAIVRDPQVFLFDEPLSNLDAKLRVQMRKEIKQLHQRLKTTTLFVTHDQVEAMTMADKIVVMNAGRVEQIGSPLELYDNPVNTFVATFIGSPSMNLLLGTYQAKTNSFLSITGERQKLGMKLTATEGQKIMLGVRPEHLELAKTGFKTLVSVIEPTGAETLAFLKYGDSEIVAMLRERHAFGIGEPLTVAPRIDKLHVFDAETGMRLLR